MINNILTEQCDENESIKPSDIEGKCDDDYIEEGKNSKIECGEDIIKNQKKCKNCKDDYIHSKHYIPPFHPPVQSPNPPSPICKNCLKKTPYRPCRKDIPSIPKRVKKCTDEYSKSITLKNCTNTLKICKNHLENKNCDDEYIHESEDTDCEDEQVKPKSSNDCCDYYDSKIRKSIIEYFI